MEFINIMDINGIYTSDSRGSGGSFKRFGFMFGIETNLKRFVYKFKQNVCMEEKKNL